MKKNIIYIVVACSILIISCLFCYVNFKKIDYWEAIGVSSDGLYDTLVKEKGLPNQIEYIDEGAYTVYDGVKFYYANKDLKGSFLRAEIYDAKYDFGNKHISVGTKRNEIISFYKNKKEIGGLPNDELAYVCNDNTIIWFEFDESNCVRKIILTRSI